MCYHVNYPNDGFDDDLLLKRKYKDNEWSYTGYLKKEKDVKLSVLLPDNDPTVLHYDEDRKDTLVSHIFFILASDNVLFGKSMNVFMGRLS